MFWNAQKSIFRRFFLDFPKSEKVMKEKRPPCSWYICNKGGFIGIPQMRKCRAKRGGESSNLGHLLWEGGEGSKNASTRGESEPQADILGWINWSLRWLSNRVQKNLPHNYRP